MAFLLTYLRPTVPPVQTLTKTWIRCLSDFSDYVRPSGPMSSWTREETNTHGRWRYATNLDYRRNQVEYSKKYVKTRYANDPDWRQARLQKENDKYANDPDWRQAKLQKFTDRYANDPEYRQARNQRNTQRAKERYANDPEYRQSLLQRLAERRATDPAFREADRLRKKERYTNDPEYRQALHQRAKERYANDPEYRARRKQRDAESYLRRKSKIAIDSDNSDPLEKSTSQDKSDGPALEP
jgi:hypothetical protein